MTDDAPLPDLIELARRAPLEEFLAACPFFLLIGTSAPARPRGVYRTMVPGVTDEETTGVHHMPLPPDGQTRLVVLAVRKVQPVFPSMITVGRTSNNDIAIPDMSVSRFHAYFHHDGDHLAIVDAGSRNGTWVGSLKLEPKTAPTPVPSSTTVTFGARSFNALAPGAAWDRLRVA